MVEETALELDLRLNHDWRCRKGESFDLQVDEKMLIHWMTRYMGKDQRDAEQVIAAIQEAIRTITMNRIDLQYDTEQLLSDAGGGGHRDNIVEIADFRKGKSRAADS
jgi:hypothetical protein